VGLSVLIVMLSCVVCTCVDLCQSQLETVVPRDNASHVMIVSGKHRAQVSLWPLCVADADIIFLPCDFCLLLFFIPRLISAVADWMFAILRHMMWS